MSIQLVIDMNLSVEWVAELARHGWSAVHWSTVGDPLRRGFGADGMAAGQRLCGIHSRPRFGTALALTHASGPSVLQVRGQDVLPEDIGPVVIAALHQHEAALAAGALVVVDPKKCRVRVLPL
jgi:predicted nuclease of predicted toxin-antitoxin system